MKRQTDKAKGCRINGKSQQENRQTESRTNGYLDRQRNRQTQRHGNRKIYRQIGRPTDIRNRQT